MSDQDEGIGALDRIYEILDLLEEDGKEIAAFGAKTAEVFAYQGVFQAVEFLDELGFSGRLGLSNSDLAKFQRISGTIDGRVLRQLVSRLKSLLREAEGEVRSISATSRVTKASESHVELRPLPSSVKIYAIEWVQNDRERNADLIADLTELLNDAISRAKGTNLPPGRAAFTEFQRKILIDLLETALQMLKAPLVEKGLLSRLGEAAGEGATNAVKKGAEVGLGFVLKRLWELMTKYMDSL